MVLDNLLGKVQIININNLDDFKEMVKLGLNTLSKNKAIEAILNKASQMDGEIFFWQQPNNGKGGYVPFNNTKVVIFDCSIKEPGDFFNKFIHELTHFVIYGKFNNRHKPLYEHNKSIEGKFISLSRECIKELPEYFKQISLYYESQIASELPAYFFGGLAKDIINKENILGKTFDPNSDLMQTIFTMMQEFDQTIKHEDLVSEVVYRSNSFHSFFENMLGIDTAPNIGDSLNVPEDNAWFGMGA